MNTALTFRGFGMEKKVMIQPIRIQNLGLGGNGARASLTLFGILGVLDPYQISKADSYKVLEWFVRSNDRKEPL